MGGVCRVRGRRRLFSHGPCVAVGYRWGRDQPLKGRVKRHTKVACEGLGGLEGEGVGDLPVDAAVCPEEGERAREGGGDLRVKRQRGANASKGGGGRKKKRRDAHLFDTAAERDVPAEDKDAGEGPGGGEPEEERDGAALAEAADDDAGRGYPPGGFCGDEAVDLGDGGEEAGLVLGAVGDVEGEAVEPGGHPCAVVARDPHRSSGSMGGGR